MIRLLDLPEEVQDAVSRGTLSMGHARALLSAPSSQRRALVFRRILTEQISVRETERLLGPEVREVTYRSAEDLDRLISFFLSKPARREELRDLFHRRVRDHFSDGPFGRLAERLRREHLPPCPKTPAIPDESLRTSAAAIGWRLRWKLKDLQWLLKRC